MLPSKYFWPKPAKISAQTSMGGFILLTRGYGFMWGVPPPFDVKKSDFYLWYEVKTLEVERFGFIV